MAKLVKKPVKLDKVRSLVKKANTLGIWTWGTFVMGFPKETRDDIIEMINYASSLKFDFVNFFMLQLHKGSEIYAQYLHDGLIKENEIHGANAMDYPFCRTEELTQDELIKLHKFAEKSFYIALAKRLCFSPSYLWKEFLPKILGVRKFVYAVRLLVNLIKMKLG